MSQNKTEFINQDILIAGNMEVLGGINNPVDSKVTTDLQKNVVKTQVVMGNMSTTLSTLDDFSSDSKLTPVEKLQVKREWENIAYEQSAVLDQAALRGITTGATEYDDYVTAYNNLNTYLNDASTGVIRDLTTTTDITGSVLRAYFSVYFLKRQVLMYGIEGATEQAITDAQNAANAYAEAQDELEAIRADAYADGQVSAEEARAIADAQAKADAAEAAANAYADTEIEAAITTLDGDIAKRNWLYSGSWYIDEVSEGFDFVFSSIPEEYKSYMRLGVESMDLESEIRIKLNGTIIVSPIAGTDNVREWAAWDLPDANINTTSDNTIRIEHTGGGADWGYIYTVMLYFDQRAASLDGVSWSDVDGRPVCLGDLDSSADSKLASSGLTRIGGVICGGFCDHEWIDNTNTSGPNIGEINLGAGGTFYHPNGKSYAIAGSKDIETNLEGTARPEGTEYYIMFIGSDDTRFSFYGSASSHDYIACVYSGGAWYYGSNITPTTAYPFTPNGNDCIVAIARKLPGTNTGLESWFLSNQAGQANTINAGDGLAALDSDAAANLTQALNDIDTAEEAISVAQGTAGERPGIFASHLTTRDYNGDLFDFTTGYSRSVDDADATGGKAIQIWRGWSGRPYLSNASAPASSRGIFLGRNYRVFARIKKIGSVSSVSYGIYNTTQAKYLGITNSRNISGELSTEYQVIDLGTLFINPDNMADTDTVYMYWLGSTGCGTSDYLNCIAIDWIWFCPVDAEDGATAGADWSTNLTNIPPEIHEIYYQDEAPTGAADGDLWIDTNDGNKLYRLISSSWTSVQDAEIQAAISAAGTAQATADGKVKTFYQTSAPTADGVGDLWFDTDDGNRAYRWSGSAWVDAADSRIATAMSDASNAQATADGKIDSFYQASAPTSGMSVGDLWIDTDNGNKLYRYNGSSWVDIQDDSIAAAQADASQAITDASTAQSTADGKVTTFIQATQPTAEGVGDLWIDSDDDNRIYRWSGSAWVDSAFDVATWSKVTGTGKPDDNAQVNTIDAADFLGDQLAFTEVGGSASNVSNLNDGNRDIGSGYASFSYSAGVKLDLGTSKWVSEVWAYWFAADGRTYDYTIRVSDDNSTWTYVKGSASAKAISRSAINDYHPSGVELPTIDRLNCKCRYILISGYGNTVNSTNHLYEAEVYSTPPGEDPYLRAYSNNIAPGAQVNTIDAGDGLAALDSTASTKLGNIEDGAQVNPADLAALDAAADAKLTTIEEGADVNRNPYGLTFVENSTGISPGGNPGEIFIAGIDAGGIPSTCAAWVYYGNTKYTFSTTTNYANPNKIVNGLICFENSGTTGRVPYVVYYDGADWKRIDKSAIETTITSTIDNYIALGWGCWTTTEFVAECGMFAAPVKAVTAWSTFKGLYPSSESGVTVASFGSKVKILDDGTIYAVDGVYSGKLIASYGQIGSFQSDKLFTGEQTFTTANTYDDVYDFITGYTGTASEGVFGDHYGVHGTYNGLSITDLRVRGSGSTYNVQIKTSAGTYTFTSGSSTNLSYTLVIDGIYDNVVIHSTLLPPYDRSASIGSASREWEEARIHNIYGDVIYADTQMGSDGSFYVAGYSYLRDRVYLGTGGSTSNTYIYEGANEGMRIQNSHGYLIAGPANTSRCHFYTDRDHYYFDKQLRIDTGQISSFDEDLLLQRADSTRIKASTSEITIYDNLAPNASGTHYLGTSSYHWHHFYARTALLDSYLRIVRQSGAPLTPVSGYMYISAATDTTGRGGFRLNDGTTWYSLNTIATSSGWT